MTELVLPGGERRTIIDSGKRHSKRSRHQREVGRQRKLLALARHQATWCKAGFSWWYGVRRRVKGGRRLNARWKRRLFRGRRG